MRRATLRDRGVSIPSSSAAIRPASVGCACGAAAQMYDNVVVVDSGQRLDDVAGRRPPEFVQQYRLRRGMAEPSEDDGRRPPHRRLRVAEAGFERPDIALPEPGQLRAASSLIRGSASASSGRRTCAGSLSETDRAAARAAGSRGGGRSCARSTMAESSFSGTRSVPSFCERFDYRGLFGKTACRVRNP